MRIIADFYYDELPGGVQTLMKNFKDRLGFRPISFKKACYAMGIGRKDPLTLRFPEFEMGIIIHHYVKILEKYVGVDVLVYNSICSGFVNHNCKTVTIINDNNLEGPRRLFETKFYSMFDYNVYRYLYFMIQKDSMKRSDAIVAPTEYLANFYRKETKKEIEVIHHGIDTNIFYEMDKLKCRKKLGLPEDKIIGIYVGWFHPIKGFHIVSRLANEYRDVFWLIILKENVNYFEKLDNVRVVYNVRYEDMPYYYNASNFLINPSMIETFGLTNIEAMACNVPVISSWEGIFRDKYEECKGIMPTGFGFLVEKHDYNLYREALDEMIYYLKNGGYYFKPESYIDFWDLDIQTWQSKWESLLNYL